ncbi:MAG TPA: hypothetical protein VJ719_13685 [Chthoniobacterales bacterium]|nr:hypothetical protein [Chthoniobacterales bacterium]
MNFVLGLSAHLLRRVLSPLALLALCVLAPANLTSAQVVLPTPTSSPSPSPSTSQLSAAVSLDPWLTTSTLWETTSNYFPAGPAFGFRWVSDAHDAARASSRWLRLGDLQVAEVIARFSTDTEQSYRERPIGATETAADPDADIEDRLSEIQISIYNRGDSGDLTKKDFDALVERSKKTVTSLTAAKPLERGTDYGSAVQSRGLVWVTPSSRFLLEWSDTPANSIIRSYRAEFIRLRITPQSGQPQTFLEQHRAQSTLAAGAAQPKTVRAAELPRRLVRDADGGERLPNIPMVDQGRKGYCVTAATERILRYYGVTVDQNELAQVADADAARGTNPDVMFNALKRLASRFRIQVLTKYQTTYADCVREINDYNQVVRQASKNTETTLIKPPPVGITCGIVRQRMNGELLLQAKTKLNPAYMTTFERNVKASIERGLPLLWSVQLGLLPEEKLNPQAAGGHMRLIVGFNPKTHEIYYSDTWGLGHEFKKMPLANAWTITDGLYILEPS